MTTLPYASYPRHFHGNSRIRGVSTMTTYGVARVTRISLSPDGCFLATGDEDGTLEVRVLQGAGAWRRVCVYTTGAAVRAIVWHPLQHKALFCGSANGAVHKITIVVGGHNSLCDDIVHGHIHFLQLSPDGRRLVIAHGQIISVIEDPFPQRQYLGTLINLDIPVENVRSLANCFIPRGIFFLSNDNTIVLVAFLGRRGLRAYSLLDHQFLWSIPLREDSIIGSAAISPSGERVAVMNLHDGIDFYSTSRRQYLSTTRYNLSSQDPPQNFLADILFVDDETVAFGHSDGCISFATFGVDRVDTSFEISRGQESAPVQVVTFGLVHNIPLVFGLASPRESPQTSIRYPSDIHIGRIETPGTTQDPLERLARANSQNPRERIPVIVLLTIGVTLVSMLLGQILLGSMPTKARTATASPRIASIDPPDDHLLTTTSAFDPLSTCICTVTGTIDGANSKESGAN